MIRINQIKIHNDGKQIKRNEELHRLLMNHACKSLRIDKSQLMSLEIIRHSVDARKKPEIYDVYMVDVKLNGLSEEKVLKKCRDKNVSLVEPVVYRFPFKNDNKDESYMRPVVIGAGPAGLFCAYELAENGYKPIILERGADVDKRTEIVEQFWKTGKLDTSTNVQFGEGGAGTFSDGKLNTMVKDKDGRGREALKIFVEHGAPEDILYDAKPHIGTDILREVVKSMRNRIIELGGEVRFESLVSEILIDESSNVSGVKVSYKGDDNLVHEEIIPCNKVVLAIGHSARDTFYMLRDKKVDMKPKPFAVGFRVEHPQKLINLSQYGIEDSKALPPASYKLTTTTDEGRGVYSFCMCPGGYVVNASSEEGRLAVNGMSYSKRDGVNANSAIIITVDPKDFGSDDILSGVKFQRKIEEKAYKLGEGRIPVERYGDFKQAVFESNSALKEKLVSDKSEDLQIDNSHIKNFFSEDNTDFLPQMKGQYVFADVHSILPDELNFCFVEGMEKFGRMIKGYNCEDALVSGVESRTSSPVRINRDENGESINIKGLFPCGEGAGYAGGIMSAAMDGMKVAEFVAG